MQWRIGILEEHGLKLRDIQDVIAQIKPLDGALEFIDWIKRRSQLIVVSDTFAQFADPLMAQLNRPTLFCHQLVIDDRGMIVDYKLRQKDPKKKVVEALQGLQYKVIAFGDSYNDTTMLLQADVGILFKPPQNVIDDFPQLPVTDNYDELRNILQQYI
jgi:phosphoserine/homoserine phosphotransferase